MALDENLTPDILKEKFKEAFKQRVSQDTPRDRWDIEDTIRDVLSHPNVNDDVINEAYNLTKDHILNTNSVAKDYSKGFISSVLAHKNASPQIAEDWITTNKDSDLYYDMSTSMHTAMANPGVNNALKEAFVENRINSLHEHDGVKSISLKEIGENLSPEFYKKLLSQHQNFKLSDTDENKKHNKKMLKLNHVLASYATTDKHTPESLKEAVDFALNTMDKHHNFHIGPHELEDYSNAEKVKDPDYDFSSRMRFINNLAKNKDLSKEDLNKLSQKAFSINKESVDRLFHAGFLVGHTHEIIAGHPNVDPTFLADIYNRTYENLDSDQGSPYTYSIVDTALENPALPQEIKNKIINKISTNPTSYDAQDLARKIVRNDSLTDEELMKIASKSVPKSNAFARIVQHKNLSPESQLKIWDASEKNKEISDTFLKRKDLNHKILKDLVLHRNQDLAIESLKHPNVNEEVLDAALNRKAPAVSNEARKHPLVASREISKGLLEGKIKVNDLIFDKKIQEHFNLMPENDKKEVIKKINENYKVDNLEQVLSGPNFQTPNKIQDFLKAKQFLATNVNSSPEVKKQNVDDILNLANALPFNSGNILSIYRNDPKSLALKNAVYSLVNENNEEAKQFLLNKDSFLYAETNGEGRSDYFKSTTNSDFIEKAWNKLKQNIESGTEIIDDRGIPVKFEYHPDGMFAYRLATNPNTPDNVFDEVYFDNRFLKPEAMPGAPLGPRKDALISFRDRIKNKNDNEKQVLFEKLFNHELQSNDQVGLDVALKLEPNITPESFKRKAWLAASDTTKSKMLLQCSQHNRTDFAHHLDKETLNEILIENKYSDLRPELEASKADSIFLKKVMQESGIDGEFLNNHASLVEMLNQSPELFEKSVSQYYPKNRIFLDVLKSLDETTEHTEIFNNFLKNRALNATADIKPQEIIDNVGNVFVRNKNLEKTIDDGYKTNPVNSATFDFILNTFRNVGSINEFKTGFDKLKEKINTNLQTDSTESAQNNLGKAVLNSLLSSKIPDQLKYLTGNRHSSKTAANKSLDFLADEDFGEYTPTVRQYLAALNLLSSDKKIEILTKNESLQIAFANLQKTKEKFDLIKQHLDSPELTNDMINTVAMSINKNDIVENSDQYEQKIRHSYNRRRTTVPIISDSDYEATKNNFIRLYNLTTKRALNLNSGPEKEALNKSKIQLISKLLTTDFMDVDQKKKIISDVETSINNEPLLDSSQKNNHIIDLYRQISLSGNQQQFNAVKKDLLKKVSEKAINENDLEAIIRLCQIDQAPASIRKKATSVLKKPDLLNIRQISKLSTGLVSGPFSQSKDFVKTIIPAFFKKIGQEPDLEKATGFKTQFLQNLIDSLPASSSYRNEDIHSPIYQAIEMLATDSSTEVKEKAQSELINQVSKFDLSHKTAKRLFINLPTVKTDGTEFELPKVTNPNIGFLNDKDIVESAQSGWKSDLLLKNVDKLSKTNKSIMINRAIQAPASNGEFHILNALKNDITTDPLDIKKTSNSLINKLGLTKAVDMMTAAYHGIGNADPIKSNYAYSLDSINNTVNNEIDLALKSNDEPSMLRLSAAAQAMSSNLRNIDLEGTEDAEDVSNKIKIFHNYIKNVSKIAELPIKDKTTNESVLKHIKNITNSLVESDLPITKDMTDSVLKITDRILNSADRSEQSYLPLLTFVTTQAENFKQDDWKNLFQKRPETTLLVGNREIIDNEVMDSLNFDFIKNELLKTNETEKAQGSINFNWFLNSIFQKMDSNAVEKYGKSIVDQAENYLITKNDLPKNKDNEKYFNSLLETAMKSMTDYFSYEKIKSLSEKFSNNEEKRIFFKNAIQFGLGGDQLFDDYAGEQFKQARELLNGNNPNRNRIRNLLDSILTSEKISKNSEKILNEMITKSPEMMSPCVGELVKNKYTSSNIIENIYNSYSKYSTDESIRESREFNQLMIELSGHPNISESTFFNIVNILNKHNKYDDVFNPGSRYNPAFLNPKFGGKAFRQNPLGNPKIPNVDIKKMPVSISSEPLGDFSKKKERLTDAMIKIGSEGITWAEAKRKFPDFEKIKEIKDVFMAKQNKPIMPEDFAKALNELEKVKKQNDFHLTYAKWDGIQRHNSDNATPNLVVQLNNSEQTEKELNTDPKLWAIYQFILRQANRADNGNIGGHPTTPQLVSWSRVDTSSNQDGWIIEELQSDFTQQFRKRVRKLIASNPSIMDIGGYKIKSNELREYVKRIEQVLEGHHQAAVEAIKKAAIQHGVKKLFMHGYQVRGHLSHGTSVGMYNKDYISPAIKKIYGTDPELWGFKKCKYTDYPNWSQETQRQTDKKFDETPCWVMDLS
jgi:hypothetical protein